jgi:hypothetical protein
MLILFDTNWLNWPWARYCLLGPAPILLAEVLVHDIKMVRYLSKDDKK